MEQVAELFLTERQKLYERFADRQETAYNLSRKVVSFQANKEEPVYRWFKCKEGFSSNLVKYFLTEPCTVLHTRAAAGFCIRAWDVLVV